jgi:hypothetical protein
LVTSTLTPARQIYNLFGGARRKNLLDPSERKAGSCPIEWCRSCG